MLMRVPGIVRVYGIVLKLYKILPLSWDHPLMLYLANFCNYYCNFYRRYLQIIPYTEVTFIKIRWRQQQKEISWSTLYKFRQLVITNCKYMYKQYHFQSQYGSAYNDRRYACHCIGSLLRTMGILCLLMDSSTLPTNLG